MRVWILAATDGLVAELELALRRAEARRAGSRGTSDHGEVAWRDGLGVHHLPGRFACRTVAADLVTGATNGT